MKGFRKAFEAGVSNDIETMWDNRKDERDSGIKLPDSLAPTTGDHNIIYVDPESDGQFSAPNPLSPNQRPKDLKASTGSSDDVTTRGVTPDVYPRLVRRVVSSAFGSVNPLHTTQPAPVPQVGRPLGIFAGRPMPDYPLSPSIWGAPAVPFAPSSNANSMGGLAGRLAALAGIDPENPEQPVPRPGGLLGLFLSGQR